MGCDIVWWIHPGKQTSSIIILPAKQTGNEEGPSTRGTRLRVGCFWDALHSPSHSCFLTMVKENPTGWFFPWDSPKHGKLYPNGPPAPAYCCSSPFTHPMHCPWWDVIRFVPMPYEKSGII